MKMKDRRHRNSSAAYPDNRIAGLKHDEKLTVVQIDDIRSRYRHHSRDANCRVLAEEFGVSTTTVHNIIREKKWQFGNWNFRERSRQPRNERYTPTKAMLRSMERAATGLMQLDPTSKKAMVMYRQYLVLQRHYDCKRNNNS